MRRLVNVSQMYFLTHTQNLKWLTYYFGRWVAAVFFRKRSVFGWDSLGSGVEK